MKKRQAPGVARRTLLAGGAAAASLGWLVKPAHASTIESARIVLGAPAGGSGDLMARKLADKLRGIYANSVVVDNRTGAGGQIALTHVKDAPGDGSVLLLTPSSLMALYPYTYRKLPYRPVEDFAPVTLTAYANHALAVGPAVPASVKTLSDFLAWAKANPSKASYGSPASGAIPHLLMAYIAHTTGAPLTHVPYRGSAVALQDLRGGTLAAHCGPAGVFLPLLGTGQVRLLCVSGEERSKFAASVPTFRESGVNLTAREWYGFFLPAKASKDVVAHANKSLRGALAQPDVAESLAQYGLEPASSTPEQLAAMMAADSEEWRAVVAKIGFTAES